MPLSTNNKRQRAKGKKKKKTACEGKTGTHKERLQNQLVLLGVSSAFSLSLSCPPPPSSHAERATCRPHVITKERGEGATVYLPSFSRLRSPFTSLAYPRRPLLKSAGLISPPVEIIQPHSNTRTHSGPFFSLLFFQTLISAQTACPIITSCALIGTYLKCLSIRI